MFRVLPIVDEERRSDDGLLDKTYSLFDLLCVGVGGTVGSGVFVLTGLIAAENGPATPLCYLIGGVGCIFSACSYAELSERIPSSGAAYTFVYATLGEYPAFLTASMLSIEYGIAAAAVSVSWGNKLSLFLNDDLGVSAEASQPDDLQIGASLLQLACVLILLLGVAESKLIVNIVTVLKLLLVVLMIVGGFVLLEPRFFSASAFSGVSARGVIRGAMSSFFAFLGYDEVCFMSAESKSSRNLPAAVFGTLSITTVLYFLAAIALVGMRERLLISKDSGFVEAFDSHGGAWVGFGQFVEIGELLTLPLVVLISFLAQPRLQMAMALDGLLPSRFAQLDKHGNLSFGIISSGVLCVLIALFVPFEWLEDVISAAVLLSFIFINASLIVLRKGREGRGTSGAGGTEYKSLSISNRTEDRSKLQLPERENPFENNFWKLLSLVPPCVAHLLLFHVAAVVLTLSISNLSGTASLDGGLIFLAVVCSILCLWTSLSISILPDIPASTSTSNYSVTVQSPSPDSTTDSGKEEEGRSRDHSHSHSHSYRVYGVPWVPLFGTLINLALLSQLKASGVGFLFAFFCLCTAVYLGYSRHHSKLALSSRAHRTASDASLDASLSSSQSTRNILSPNHASTTFVIEDGEEEEERVTLRL